MKITNAFKIFFKNYTLVLKVAITQLVFSAIILGLGSLVASDVIVDVNTGLLEYGIIEKFKVIVDEISSGTFDAQRFSLLMSEFERAIFSWGSSVDFFYEKVAISAILIFTLIFVSA